MQSVSSKHNAKLFTLEQMKAEVKTLLHNVENLNPEANLIELGLDSMAIMRLVDQWRRQGVKVTFADLIETPTLQYWYSLVQVSKKVNDETVSITELLARTSSQHYHNETPFPLTDVQYAYWVGRQDSQQLGGVGCHAYIELDGNGVKAERLKQAWQQLQQQHSMLRARFTEDGQQLVSTEMPPIQLSVNDFSNLSPEQVNEALLKVSNRLSHRKLDVDNGQVFGLELSLLPNGKTRVHFDVDLLVADVQSLHILLRDLAAAYNQTPISTDVAKWRFSQYLTVEAERNQAQLETDKHYWQERLIKLPSGPQLPLLKDPQEITKPKFIRRAHLLKQQSWQQIKSIAASYKITPAMVLATAYAEILAKWSAEQSFVLNLPLFDRKTDHPNIENVVADFTNLLLLECNCQQKDSFADRALSIQRQFHTDVAHSSYSAVSIQRDLVKQGLAQGVSAPVVFACNLGTPLLTEECRQTLGEFNDMISQTPQVWLDHQLYEVDDGLLLAWDCVDELFPENLIDTMFTSYVKSLEWLAKDQTHWQQPSLTNLPEQQSIQRQQVNNTTTTLTQHSLHQGMFDIAATEPQRIALIDGNIEFTYQQLANASLQVASLLQLSGLNIGDPVAITLPRGIAQVCAVFGILAAGGCYVPIGIHQPTSRQAKIHRTAGIKLVLTDTEHLQRETSNGVTRLDVTTAAQHQPIATPVNVSPEQAAYIIFTSGSTGEPKGVEMAHAATANTIDHLNQRYNINENSRVLAVSALDFDLSVYDLFGVLTLGGAIVLLQESQRRDASAWLTLIHQHQVNVWNSVPVLLDMLLVVAEPDNRTLPFKQVMLSGDWIGLDLPPRLAANTTTKNQLIAMGGATEAAIWSNAFDVTTPLPAHWTSIPYGKPLANQSYRVVDSQGRDCPDWVPGELWIGGAGLANGYKGDTELTQQRFVTVNGQRWYRTGDRGRYWPDGNLEFLGRLDHQVKVRGHRIELGEIETALTTIPGIARATVVAVGQPKSLAAALVANAETELNTDYIRQALHELVPDYMVPTTLATLDAIPLSANGKVDRKQVIQQLSGFVSAQNTKLTPPNTPHEHIVAELWQDLLSAKCIGRESNFFELGGDSLLATQVITQLRQQGLSAPQPLRLLFAKPILAQFAAELSQGQASEIIKVIPQPEQRYQPFPLTEVQRAYWMGQSPGLPLSCGTHYLVELDGENVDLSRIENAWNSLVKRHEMLKAIVDQDGQQCILQQIPDLKIAISYIDKDNTSQLIVDPAKAAQDHLHQCWYRQSNDHKKNIQNESSINYSHQIHAVKYGDNRCRLGIIFNYLTLDGFSIKLLLQELAELYENSERAMPELELSFRDYITQVQPEADEVEAAKAYWQQKLNNLPLAPELPLAMDPTNLTNVKFHRREEKLSKDTWRKLKKKARENQITPSVLLLVTYSQIIRKWNSDNDFTLNLTLFDRRNVHVEINKILGDFTSLAPIAFHQSNGNSFLQQAQATQQEIADALEHRTVSSIWVQRERSRQMSLTSAALPVVFTSTLGLGGGLFEKASQSFPELVAGGLSETPQVWLDHQLYEYKDQLVISWDTAEALFPTGMLDNMFSAYINLLEQLVESDWTTTLQLNLPEQQSIQRQQVNNTTTTLTQHSLHQGMFDIATTEPQRIALIDGNIEFTYQQLANASLQVASLLQLSGLNIGDPVAITLPRGIAQVCAVFGILAAGGCYVPIGIHQPTSRQAKIHRTAGIKLVLTDTEHLQRETSNGVTRLDVTTAAQHQPIATPVNVSPEQAAYIIFTSGSTGEPKGVEMAHAATANTIDHLNQRYNINENSRVLAVSALDFDLSVYDLFGVLTLGGAIVLLQESQRRDASAWLTLIHQHQVNVWNSVPVLLDMLLVVAEPDNRTLPFKQVMLSGDWIGLDLPPRLAANTTTKNQLIAMGGATEAAIWSNAFDVTTPLPAHWTSIPYGKPLANQSYRVVDSQGRDCPDWVPGELWIGGAGLANGYKGDTELTQQRFVTVNGQRWYRTGDRGRYWPDGNLEFLGRLDHQVKVRGHRIELGEIETALTTIPGIARATVVAVGQPKSLAAALVANAETELNTDYIRQALHELVPDYMVPTTLATLDAIPLSANGKVDRKQVIQQLSGFVSAQNTKLTPPNTPHEHIVAELWQDLLSAKCIGRESNFFELGGDSLLATQVITQLRQQGLSAPQPLRLLFAKPILAQFAAELSQGQASEIIKVIPQPEQRYQPFPLTEVQRAYWMGQSPGLPLSCGTHYLVELDGENVDLSRIENAWNTLVKRHEMLRVKIDEQGNQQILKQVARYQIAQSSQIVDNVNVAQTMLEKWWKHYSQEDRSSLFAIKAIHYGNDLRCRIGIIFSYMTLDGFSIKLLLQELSEIYQNPNTKLPEFELSFRDYVTQVSPQPDTLERAETYWKKRLETLPNTAQLPLAKDPITVRSVHFSRRQASLNKHNWQALRKLAKQHGITPSVMILVVYAEILSQWSGGQAHTLNLTLFDRQAVHPDINKIVGDFTSLAPVAYQPDDDKTLLQLAQDTQNEIAEALEHREISSVWVQRERARTMGLTAAALPVVFTSTLGMSDSLFEKPPEDSFPDLAGGGLSETPQVWLDHQMYEHRGELVISWDGVDELFPDGMLDEMFSAFMGLLDKLSATKNLEKKWLEISSNNLPEQQSIQRQQVNNTTSTLTQHSLHQGMFDIATTEPQRIALIDGNIEFTYQQLANASLQVASLLQLSGLNIGDPVAITLPRGIAQVCAVFGILAAGGCYVPIGIHQPTSRQAKIHRTAGIKLVLTDTEHLQRETSNGVTRLDVTTAAQHQPIATPVNVSPEQAAYIIFTSGSTGEPKGVEMAHAATANTIDHLNQRYNINENSRVLAVSALDFDLSVYDLFGVLTLGGAIVLLQESQRRDASAWLTLIHQHQVNVWNSVPVLLDMLLVVAEPDNRTLPFKQVMLSGDWIGLDLPPRLAANTTTKNQLIAMGGATEAAIWSNAFDVTTPLPAHWTSIPYGKPLANQSYRVVDSQGRDCPDWVPGELWIGGAGLANGYKGDTELTQQRFVTVNGQRWYRTGDRGRYWPDGNLEFLGRLDHQVKVRGHRIELGEIETALTTIPGIARATVVAVGQPKSLAAALVANAETELNTDYIRQALHELVPDYMVPTTLATLDAIPLSANGKVDRKQVVLQLQAIGIDDTHYEAPANKLEQQISDIWREALNCERVSRHDDFFLIGGNSLTATQIIQLLQKRHVSPADISLTTLFSAPNIAALAEEIERSWQVIGVNNASEESTFEEGTI